MHLWLCLAFSVRLSLPVSRSAFCVPVNPSQTVPICTSASVCRSMFVSLSGCVCVPVCLWMHTAMSVCMSLSTCVSSSVSVSVPVYLYVYFCWYLCFCFCLCPSVSLPVCVLVCVCLCLPSQHWNWAPVIAHCPNGRLEEDLGFGGFAFAVKLPELLSRNLPTVRAKISFP